MKYGPGELAYLKAKGAPELADMPNPENAFFWMAYGDLRGSRSVGMDVGAIPITEIKAYAEAVGMNCPVQFSRLLRFIQALDCAEREHYGKSGT